MFLQFSLYSLSLICCTKFGLVQKRSLCSFYVLSSFGKPLGTRQALMAPGALAAGLEQLSTGCQVGMVMPYGSCVLIFILEAESSR